VLGLALVSLAAAGCATGRPALDTGVAAPGADGPGTPPPAASELSARQRLAALHRAEAARLEVEGRLRQALDQQRIALTIDPRDPAAGEAKRALEARIEREVTAHIEAARAALGGGARGEARHRFLAALALDPGNRVAFEALRGGLGDPEFVLYTVRAGDTLASLAERYYGDRNRGEVIAEINQLAQRARLAGGTMLKIPEIPGVPFNRPDLARRLPPAAAPVAPSPDRKTAPEPQPARRPETPPAREEPADVNPLIAEAREALDRRDYAGALEDLGKLLASTPGQPEATDLRKLVLYRQGKTELEARRYREAYASLRELTTLAPGYEDTATLLQKSRVALVEQHYAQGIQYYREERLGEAIVQWRAVLELDPKHANARRNLEQSERLLKGLEERRRKP
jgi:tetratricopeptide (TPR) repeat protein